MPKTIGPAWDAFLANGLPPTNGFVEDALFETDLFPLQRKAELLAMLELTDTKTRAQEKRAILVIGSDKGGDVFHFARVLRLAPIACRPKLVAIEIRGVPWADAFARAFPEIDFCAIEASSYDPATVQRVRNFMRGELFDCVFLDGAKAHVREDFKAYAPMMRSGGLAFVHDIVDDIEPKRFFYSLAPEHRLTAIIDGREGAEAQKRGSIDAKDVTSYEQWLRYWGATSCGVGVVHV